VATEGGAVAFYFTRGSADLPLGSAEALAEVVKGVAAGKKAVIQSAQDRAEDPAADLSQRRALAVQGVLTALGIGPDKLELRPPAADGGDALPRRVTVTLE
jgi:outer membrane protein OmpA-like peptidoglycan-associated protein